MRKKLLTLAAQQSDYWDKLLCLGVYLAVLLAFDQILLAWSVVVGDTAVVLGAGLFNVIPLHWACRVHRFL